MKQSQLDRGEREDGLTSDQQEELRRLRRQVRKLESEREILKRAVTFFVRRPIGGDALPADRRRERTPTRLPPLIFEESEQTYGSPRVFKELKLGRGLAIGEKRVARLMRQAGLVSIYAKKRKGSTTRAKEHPLAPDLVQRDFAVDAPDRLWVADFTQLTTWQGTCYIAVVADA